MEPKWLVWAREIQATAQTGLAYTNDMYDQQRYKRLRELSADIMAEFAGIDSQVVQGLFAHKPATQRLKSTCVVPSSKRARYFWSKSVAMQVDGRSPVGGQTLIDRRVSA